MSLKTLTLAFASVLVLSGSAFAGDLMDDLSAGMDVASINDAGAELEELDLGGLDVDQMAQDAGEETDAIETCFRRFGGHHSRGWNHWGGYRSYNYGHCYNNYSYACYRPLYCYRPVVSCYTHCLPVVTSYWGCY
ncbi:hypothetical protein Pla108_36200 [Botrimarina colliarenosi]|uniref:Uncharacterized protein n=1 Tax=Botrimarina colliarenosi TaxID=2528001 RepID=A0A5C6A6S1_9BACT|nr:hypothetical protein [Botrimarina colliarenosi]TWT94771.1 hypothetical protein Pla108_36200 [Botrimarina colliarenosi]